MGAHLHADLRDFRRFYRQHFGLVWHALHRFGTAPDALEDAAQDVFMVAYRRRGSYGGGSPKAWLYGISRRVSSNYRRARQRQNQRRGVLTRASHRALQVGLHEAIVGLDRYLQGLRPIDREMFVLSELEGMSGPEIAEAFGKNVQTVYTRLRKLRRDLVLGDETRQRTRDSRPQATAQGWAVLGPALGLQTAKSAGWFSMLGAGWKSALIGATVAAIAVPVVARMAIQDRSQPASTSSTTFVPEPRLARAAATAAVVTDAGPNSVPLMPASRVPAVPSQSVPEPTRALADALPRSSAPPPSRRTGPPSTRRRSKPTVADSNALLRRAATQLESGSAPAAQATLDEHARKFGEDAMADLRRALRIDALCLAGKTPQARAEAAAFIRRHPTSPLSERVEKSCPTP